jgi:hypothetical protein
MTGFLIMPFHADRWHVANTFCRWTRLRRRQQYDAVNWPQSVACSLLHDYNAAEQRPQPPPFFPSNPIHPTAS